MNKKDSIDEHLIIIFRTPSRSFIKSSNTAYALTHNVLQAVALLVHQSPKVSPKGNKQMYIYRLSLSPGFYHFLRCHHHPELTSSAFYLHAILLSLYFPPSSLVSVFDLMLLLLRRSTPQSPKSRGNVALSVVVCNVLLKALQPEDHWPPELAEVFERMGEVVKREDEYMDKGRVHRKCISSYRQIDSHV